MNRDVAIQRYLLRRPHLAALHRSVPAREIDSPLIRLLESMPARERLSWRHLRLDPSLGYEAAGVFQNGETLLRWLKPQQWLVGSESTPAESRRHKAFNKALTRDDLRPFAAQCPACDPPGG